jgi:membrane-bound serine protease (ClpP class)
MSLALAIALFGLGLALIVAELLFPSFGMLSVLAAGALIGSIAMAFALDADTGFVFVAVAAVAVPAALLTGLKLFPKSPLGKHMVARGLSFESRRATDERDLDLSGKRGLVVATLRPAGIARIEGRRVDVVSRGEMIESGSPVRVLSVEGNRVVVVRDEDSQPESEESPR